MGNTKVKASSGEGDWSRLTDHAKDANTSKAMKRLLKQFRSLIKTNEWLDWMKEHEDDPSVYALRDLNNQGSQTFRDTMQCGAAHDSRLSL